MICIVSRLSSALALIVVALTSWSLCSASKEEPIYTTPSGCEAPLQSFGTAGSATVQDPSNRLGKVATTIVEADDDEDDGRPVGGLSQVMSAGKKLGRKPANAGKKKSNVKARTGSALMQAGTQLNAKSVKVPDLNLDDPFAGLDDDFDEVTPGLVLAAAEREARERDPARFAKQRAFLVLAIQFVLGAIVVQWHSSQEPARTSDHGTPTAVAPENKVPIARGVGDGALGKALAQAASAGDTLRARELLQRGASVVAEDSWGCTALHFAADAGALGVSEALLEHGADVMARETWEEVPLHYAARSGSWEVCRLLLAHGAEINAVNSSGDTALLEAGRSGEEAVCELLLSRGGGVGGASDADLPPMLTSLLVRNMFTSALDTVSA